jgi:hypothetical protein
VLKHRTFSVTLTLDPESQLPSRIRIASLKRTLLEVEYVSCSVVQRCDESLFQPPEGVTITEEREQKEKEQAAERRRNRDSRTAPAKADSVDLLTPEAVLNASVDQRTMVDFVTRTVTLGEAVLRTVKPSTHMEAALTISLAEGAPTGVQLVFKPNDVPEERQAALRARIAQILPSLNVSGEPVSFLVRYILRSQEELAEVDQQLAVKPPKWGLSRLSPENVEEVKAALSDWEAGKYGDRFTEGFIVGGALWSRITARSPTVADTGIKASFVSLDGAKCERHSRSELF